MDDEQKKMWDLLSKPYDPESERFLKTWETVVAALDKSRRAVEKKSVVNDVRDWINKNYKSLR